MLSSRDMSMEESESAKNLDTFSTRSMARSAAEYAPLTAVAGDFSNRSNAIPFAALDTGPSWRRSCHARMNRLEIALSSITRTASSRESAGILGMEMTGAGSRPAHPSSAPATSTTNFLDAGLKTSPPSPSSFAVIAGAPFIARTSIVGDSEYRVSWLSDDENPREE